MIDFTTSLREEVVQKIREIESGEPNILSRSLAASEMLEEVFGRLKSFVNAYTFTSEEEEIHFFKEIKPRIFCHLLYYHKVFNIEMNRPMGSLEAQADYLNRELADISLYISRRLDFYRYIRSGAVHLDRCYFLRGNGYGEDQYRDSFYFERDPVFSTAGDFKVAKILSYDLLQVYLREQLETLGDNRLLLAQTPLIPVDSPRWTAAKALLIEVLYAWDTMGVFDNGRISLRKLQKFIEMFFDIRLGNISRTFNEMKNRENPTRNLDEMRDALRRRMDEPDMNRHSVHFRK